MWCGKRVWPAYRYTRMGLGKLKNNLKNKFLIIIAKYDVIEPYYMEGTTPDQLP